MENEDVGSSHSSVQEETLEQKHSRLQKEFNKVRSQLTVLKNVVIEERKSVSELKTQMRLKDQTIRRQEQETESLRFCNGQIQSRLVVLQKDLAERSSKTKNGRNKESIPVDGPSSSAAALNADFVQLVEINAHLSTQLSSVQTDYQNAVSDLEKKLDLSMAGEKTARRELEDYKAMYESLENRIKTESEISAKKTVSDLRARITDFQMENERLKSEADGARREIDDLKKNTADTNHQSEILKRLTQQIDSQKEQLLKLQQEREKHMLDVQLLKFRSEHGRDAVDGSGDDLIDRPNVSVDEKEWQGNRVDQLRNRIHSLVCELQHANGKAFHYQAECSALQLRLQLAEKTSLETNRRLSDAQSHIDDLKKQMETTVLQTNEQMALMSEHLVVMNEKLQQKTDEINLLKYELNAKLTEGKLKNSKSGLR